MDINSSKWNDEDLTQFLSGQLLNLQNSLSSGRLTIAEIGDLIPGSVMVQDIGELKVEYMNQWGCDTLHHSREELTAMGPQYYGQFFPQEEIQQRIRDARAVLSRKDESEVFSFFQRVRPTPDADFQWYFTSMKVLKRQSGTEKEEVVVISHKVSGLEPSARKMHRLLDENEYMKKHLKKFASLTKREKEVITMLVNGRSSGEIGSILCISTHTVNTHRKNINEKLQCRSFAEMLKFAMAFDLIEEKF